MWAKMMQRCFEGHLAFVSVFFGVDLIPDKPERACQNEKRMRHVGLLCQRAEILVSGGVG